MLNTTTRIRAVIAGTVIGVGALGLAALPSGATVYPPDTAATTTTSTTTTAPPAQTAAPVVTVATTTTVVGVAAGGGTVDPGGPAVATAASVGGAGALPATGSNTATPVKFGVGFIVVGLVLAMLAHRRRRPAANALA